MTLAKQVMLVKEVMLATLGCGLKERGSGDAAFGLDFYRIKAAQKLHHSFGWAHPSNCVFPCQSVFPFVGCTLYSLNMPSNLVRNSL